MLILDEFLALSLVASRWSRVRRPAWRRYEVSNRNQDLTAILTVTEFVVWEDREVTRRRR